MAELEKCLDKVYVPLEAGDAMFFHCNLLHTSSANNSERRRWALLTAYNCNHNSPYVEVSLTVNAMEMVRFVVMTTIIPIIHVYLNS